MFDILDDIQDRVRDGLENISNGVQGVLDGLESIKSGIDNMFGK